jgi:Cof subfamily protein (haloacid dehalogenase superfamily)
METKMTLNAPLRLIATDLDGTLLLPDKTVSPRNRQALAAAIELGIEIVIATARPPFSTRLFAESAGVTGHAICANGAMLYDLRAQSIVRHHAADPDMTSTLIHQLRSRLPGVCFAAVQEAEFSSEPAYAATIRYEDHGRQIEEMIVCDALEFTRKPITKLIIRHPEIAPADLLPHVQDLTIGGLQPTFSGAPFLEIVAEGVNKGTGLAALCEHLGIPAESVVAFGDAQNDAAMLEWAGHGVAMANAFPDALAVANEVTLTNVEDGVAVVIERLLAEEAARATLPVR